MDNQSKDIGHPSASTLSEEEQRLENKRRIIRDLCESSINRDNPLKKGFFPASTVRMVVFYIITVNLVATAVFSLLGIWGILSDEEIWKVLSSFCVIIVASLMFLFVNQQFGD